MPRQLGIGLCAFAVVTALAASVAAEEMTSGRRIFGRGGGDTAGEIVAIFAETNTPLPPGVRRCASCHGRDGVGGRESGAAVPPITWLALLAPREASPGRPGRPGYDEAALQRALAEGVDSAGNQLAPGMPRFQLTSAQVTALFDYLRILGTDRDLDPGISAEEIRVGAVLPLSGAQAAWGQSMRTGLEIALATAGPIYGRRLRLIAVDADDDVAGSLRRIAIRDQVFALVATMLPAGADVARDTEDMPIVGPLIPTPAEPATNHFYLLAPVEDQMRVLVDHLIDETRPAPRLAVIGPKGHVADAVVDQARRKGAMIVHHPDAEDLMAVLPPAVDPAPAAVLALPGVNLERLVAQLADQPGAPLLAGPAEALALSAARDERLRLALPILPADPRGRDPSAAVPPFAAAASAVLIEGVKRMGARASRAGLIAALETLGGFPTGVLPPLTFGRGQHVGSYASIVVRPDRMRGIIVLGDWRKSR